METPMESPGRKWLGWLVLVGLPVAACGSGGAPEAAVRVALTGFVTTLQQGDRTALREHVSIESREYLDQLPLPSAAEPVDLVLGAPRVEGARAVCRVVETRGDERRDGSYVLVKEDGRWCVDLVETAGMNCREVSREGPPLRWKIVPVPAVADRVR
jgi:hypothetical protein